MKRRLYAPVCVCFPLHDSLCRRHELTRETPLLSYSTILSILDSDSSIARHRAGAPHSSPEVVILA